MSDDWAARDAYANYHEALRVMRASLLEQRARADLKGMVASEGGRDGGWGRVQPPPVEGGNNE